jgi:hypothetical protein
MTEPRGFPMSLPITDEDDEDVEDVRSSSKGEQEQVVDDADTKTGARAASLDSDTDLDGVGSKTVPLHFIQKEENSLNQGATLVSRQDTFEDEANFEILPDDDDAGDEGVAQQQQHGPNTPGRLVRRSSAPSPVSTPIISLPRSPINSPTNSPPPSPMTPSRNILSQIAAPLTPINRVAWKQNQEYEDSEVKIVDERQQQQDGKHNTKAHRRNSTTDNGFVLRSPGPLRAIFRAGMTPFKGTAAGSSKDLSVEPSMGTDDWGQDDGSSSDEEYSEDEEELSTDDESSVFDDGADDAELVSDFSSIPPMPNSFLDLPPDLYDYLDPELVKNITSQKISTFAYEHHLLVKGLLQLLAERDVVGVEGDIHDASNVVKMGPLKKKSSRGLWSVKYVEIRRGNLSYFSDNASQFGNPRKTIHLRKRTCQCVPLVETNSNADSFVFQLLVEGGPKKLWMAKSDEERQGWIRAINQAMIGETEGSQDAPVDLSMYQSAIETYRSVQGPLKQVESREDYLVAVDGLLYRKSSSSALRIPMTWVREEVQQHDDNQKDAHTANALVKTSISENWKCLSNTSVDINDCLISADTVYSAERVIGTLSRCILEFGRVDDCEREEGISTKTIKRSGKDSFMTEVEAVSYARTILFGALRSQIRGDVTAAVQNLVQNESVAHVGLEKLEPLQIDVSFSGDDFSERPQPHDMSGWLMTRPKRGKVWKKRFFVVSEGILSFFAKAEPRPYDLRGQLVLSKCTIKPLDDENVLLIERDEEGRCLQFEDRGVLLKWRAVLERAADPEFPVVIPDPPSENNRRRGKRGTIAVKPLKTATRGAMKAMKGAKNASMKTIKNARGRIARGIASRQRGQGLSREERRASTHDMLMRSTRGIAEEVTEKREPTVQVVTEFNHVFKVMPVPSTEGAEPLL